MNDLERRTKAVRISDRKWTELAQSRGNEEDDCGFCKYFGVLFGQTNKYCTSCPLFPDICADFVLDSDLPAEPLFWDFRRETDTTKKRKIARQIRDAIRERGARWIKEADNGRK